KDQIVAEGHHFSQKGDFAFDGIPSGVELPLFIELPIVRNISFRNDSKQAAAIDDQRAVKQFSFKAQLCSDQQHSAEIMAFLDDPCERMPAGVEHDILMEQIIIRVSGYSEF